LFDVAAALKAPLDETPKRLLQLLDELKTLNRELERMKGKLASASGGDLAAQAKDVNGIKVLAALLDGADAKSLRDTVDQLKNKLGSAVVLLAAVEGDKVSLVAGVTKDLTDRFKAGDLLQQAAQAVGGKGGGRADMAQGGGTDAAGLPKALALAEQYVNGVTK
jgi:alanyl-tRNA synthetase